MVTKQYIKVIPLGNCTKLPLILQGFEVFILANFSDIELRAELKF